MKQAMDIYVYDLVRVEHSFSSVDGTVADRSIVRTFLKYAGGDARKQRRKQM